MKSRDEIFIPLLNTFVSLNLKAIENCGYPWGLFVPYGFSQYYNGNPKIFYVGIALLSTKKWTGLKIK